MVNCTFQKRIRVVISAGILLITSMSAFAQSETGFEKSIARVWNEQLLWAIRLDSARPTVHARNLYHLSAAMWDAWAAYDPEAKGVFVDVDVTADDVEAARHQAISYAAYRVIVWRFRKSPNVIQTESSANRKMAELGYDVSMTQTGLDSPAALGNLVADTIIKAGLSDGSNEENNYGNLYYKPINPPLTPLEEGNPTQIDPNRWQPLDIPNFVGQSGQQSVNYPPFVGPEWGNVTPFSLKKDEAILHQRDGHTYRLYMDPGPPPMLGTESDADFRAGVQRMIEYSQRLDPNDGIVFDVSPAARGNNPIGTNDGTGHALNPVTGRPYKPQWVLAGDYYRVLAEFWADGPSSETPPGHWFVMLNVTNDRIREGKRRFKGQGRELDILEWDVRSYLAMGGAMHDVAVAAWSNKGWYDYTRPISAVRYLCEQGQRTDPDLPGFGAGGIDLVPGLIEVITEESVMPDARHAHLRGENAENIGKIAVRSWRGPIHVDDPKTDTAGVGWILCGNWWPYQRHNFVTPPFAGYVSGHSTYSRAAAEVLTLLTGSNYFPDGYAVFRIEKNEYLRFEEGPTKSFTLQWATFQDAADESAISRIYGGIHPPGDDVPGRVMGYKIGHKAFAKAEEYFPESN